jgi:hypothetical protein
MAFLDRPTPELEELPAEYVAGLPPELRQEYYEKVSPGLNPDFSKLKSQQSSRPITRPTQPQRRPGR